MFTQSAFIRKNTPELREKLTEQGHRICSCCENTTGWLFTNTSNDIHAVSEEEREEFLEDVRERPDEMIDCEINEELFLALTALRDDSDYMQFFYVKNLTTSVIESEAVRCCSKTWRRSNIPRRKHHDYLIRKLTPKELIEHFKDE